MLKFLLNLLGKKPDARTDGNQERPLPPRWRDPAPKPEHDDDTRNRTA